MPANQHKRMRRAVGPLRQDLIHMPGVSSITCQTRRMNSTGTLWWKSSDIEFTNTLRGFDHEAGMERDL